MSRFSFVSRLVESLRRKPGRTISWGEDAAGRVEEARQRRRYRQAGHGFLAEGRRHGALEGTRHITAYVWEEAKTALAGT